MKHDIELTTVPDILTARLLPDIAFKLRLHGYEKPYPVATTTEHDTVRFLVIRGGRVRKDIVNRLRDYVAGYVNCWAHAVVAEANERHRREAGVPPCNSTN